MKEYTINSELLSVSFLDFGGRITSITSPLFEGNAVLAYPREESENSNKTEPSESYLEDDLYLGAIVGRYANRIGGARFTLDDAEYKLDTNDGKNCLHGGFNGYSSRVFDVSCSYSSALLKLHDGNGIFPGNLDVIVKYSVAGATLSIQYQAKADKSTYVNLTNHTYFDPFGDICDCYARFNSDFFTPVDSALIPGGALRSVESTPFDFREYRRIGEHIDSSDSQIVFAGGYDHNFVIRGANQMRTAAEVYMPSRDLKLTVTTDMPGFQFYTGNFLKDAFSKREGFCIETQFFPDTPNKKAFPSCIATPEKPFRGKTFYTFSRGRD